MLYQVEAQTEQGLILPLPLQDISGGYLVKDIEGLDPVQANIVSSSFARLDGEQYQSSRREKRNIILKLGLEPDYSTTSVRSLRDNLYKFFMPKKVSYLKFLSEDFPTLNTEGRVESFVCPLFTADPEATISIICFDPDFYDPEVNTISESSVSTETDINIVYDGSVDSGIVFTLNVNRTLTGFTIYHTPEGEQARTMTFAGSLLAGDVLEISTVPGKKYATLNRAGVSSSFLYGVSPYSDWIRLQPGNNGFRVQMTGAAVPYTVGYTEKYGGL
jgi:hypothetical protein